MAVPDKPAGKDIWSGLRDRIPEKHHLRLMRLRERFPTLANLLILWKKKFSKVDPADPYYQNYNQFLTMVNQMENHSILELGSKNGYTRDSFKAYKEYVGLDIHDGDNVDVIGDVHDLQKSLPRDKFDAVYCLSVFEHVAMPWKAILEINKVMKKGGLLFIATHPTWPPHALPWDFWRYNSGALRVLINKTTGFEMIKCEEGLPCSILPYSNHESMAGIQWCPAFMGVSLIARKIDNPSDKLSWDVDIKDITETIYPDDNRTRIY